MSSDQQSQDDIDAIMAAATGAAPSIDPPEPAPGGAQGGAVLPGLDSKAGPEGRQTKRARAKFSYSLMTKSADGRDMKLAGYTEDISAGGVSIVSTETIPANSILAIRIEMVLQGKHEPIIATGRCVHQTFSSKVGGFRYGVQFVKIADGYKASIDKYVKLFGVTPPV